MAKIELTKSWVDAKSFIQVDSLFLSRNLLKKDYFQAQIKLRIDERGTVDGVPDQLIWRRGEYEVNFNQGWNSVSDPRNVAGGTEIHTMEPYYNTAADGIDPVTGDIDPLKKYNGKLDPTNISGKTRADGTPAVAPFYDPIAAKNNTDYQNDRYAFIALRGAFVPESGSTWVIENASCVADGDNITLVASLRFKLLENENFDAISCPESAAYDTTAAEYNPLHDSSNIEGKTRKDGTPATDADNTGATVGYFDGNDYTEFLEDFYDNKPIINIPIPSKEDRDKVIIAHTNSSLSVALATVITDNSEVYKAGDKVFVPTGKIDLGTFVKGTDWAPVADTTFVDEYVLVGSDIDQLIGLDEPTKAWIQIPDYSFNVDSLIFESSYVKR